MLLQKHKKGWNAMIKSNGRQSYISRQYKVASDGKVYFVEDGLLQVVDTMKEYEELIAYQDKKKSTYFEITVENTFYKHLMCDRDGVFRILAMIKNIEERITETRRYLKDKEEAGL